MNLPFFHPHHPVSHSDMRLNVLGRIRLQLQFFSEGCHEDTQRYQTAQFVCSIDPNLRHIRNLKERYIQFNKQYGNNPKQARKKLSELIDIYRNCPYSIFHDVAETLSYHFESIVNSFIMIERMCADGTHISRLSNGPMESFNRIAKDMKRTMNNHI